MADTNIQFAGIEFPNPLVLAPGPPSKSYAYVKQAVDAGVGGVVFKTAVPDSLALTRKYPRPRYRLLGSRDDFWLYSSEQSYHGTLDEYFDELARVKRDFGVPLFASFLATETSEWTELCRRAEDAGVDGIELDISCPHSTEGAKSFEEVVAVCADTVELPIVPKLGMSPAVVDYADRAKSAGAAGVTLCNRMAALDVAIDEGKPVMHRSYAGFGGPWSRYFVFKIVSDVASQVDIPISATGGVVGWQDVVKYLMLGASTVQVCSHVMLKGYGLVSEILDGLRDYLDSNGTSPAELRGGALPHLLPLEAVEREPGLYFQVDPSLCNACGRCETVCFFDAVTIGEVVRIDPSLCDGCGLCAEVCGRGAIAPGTS